MPNRYHIKLNNPKSIPEQIEIKPREYIFHEFPNQNMFSLPGSRRRKYYRFLSFQNRHSIRVQAFSVEKSIHLWVFNVKLSIHFQVFRLGNSIHLFNEPP